MQTLRILLFQILALLLAGHAAAQATLTDAVARYRQVITQNDAQATQAAIQMFRAVLDAAPGEHRATVYIGSLTASQAKQVWLPWKKLRYVNDGIDLMDKGVEALDELNKGNGENARALLEAHMVRAITSARLPKRFKRETVAAADFKLIREHPAFARMDMEDKAAVWAFSAVLQHRQGNASAAADFFAKARGESLAVAEKIWAEK